MRFHIKMTGQGIKQKHIGPERGGVLVTVLIIAAVFAVLAYITLQVSIHSLESADIHSAMYQARVVAEGGIQSAAARLRQGEFGDDTTMLPAYIDPSYALTVSENELRNYLIDVNNSTERIIGEYPLAYERTGYTVDTKVSTSTADTELISGSHDDALYRYLDDYIFSEDYPAYEFEPVHNTGDLVVYGVGEVLNREGDQTIFSFLRGQFPNTQWNYDVREAGVTEPSRLGPYPLIETEHPYLPDQSRNWVVSYQKDPQHPGRHIKNIQLLANSGDVGIDNGDTLWITYWNEGMDQFMNPPMEIVSGFTQFADGPFHNELIDPDPALDITTLGLYFLSDAVSAGGSEFGFRTDGVRYHFDEDESLVYYETPHPYDEIVPMFSAVTNDLNIQTIYAPYQPPPMTAQWFNQQMVIQFDPDFSLDGTDTLLLYNASDQSPPAPIAMWNSTSPPPATMYAPLISHPMLGNPDLPLGYILVLVRDSDTDTDGTQNFGYKITGLEYTDQNDNWVRVENPVMETPHSIFLAANDAAYTLPNIGLPLPLPASGNYAGYQTIYRPFCPNAEAADGIGTIDEWFMTFADAMLNAQSGASNSDFIRITTPGQILVIDDRPPIPVPYDTLFYVHRNSSLGGNIYDPADNTSSVQYRDIDDLADTEFDLGNAQLVQLEFLSDSTDIYEANNNFGYRLGTMAYTTSDGSFDDWTPPTIRTDTNFPANPNYPAYGVGVWQRAEWWYTNNDPTPEPLLIGLHFDRYHFDLDPGDEIQVYDGNGILIATLNAGSVTGGPSAGGPENPDIPSGGQQSGHGPTAGGPDLSGSGSTVNVIDLNATYGWVLVPGKTAQVILYGDGDANDGFAGFEIDHCAYVNGEITEIRDYVMDYTELAYESYYDRTSSALQAFRTLGTD